MTFTYHILWYNRWEKNALLPPFISAEPEREMMIKTIAELREDYIEYGNPDWKIKRMVENGHIFQVKRGIYETNGNVPGRYLAAAIQTPSYLSFEYALVYYGIIKEDSFGYTSATCGVKKHKKYENHFGNYYYQDVPAAVFDTGIEHMEEEGYEYDIADPEKAVCDLLYKAGAMNNMQEMRRYLFEELGIWPDDFFGLKLENMYSYSRMYRSRNHRILERLINTVK